MPLLKLQRTDHKDPARHYGADLARTFETFEAYLPPHAERVLDIGSGMAGIDVLLARHYAFGPEIWLADRESVSPDPRYGFARMGQDASPYNCFGDALALLEANDVPRSQVVTVNLDKQPLPRVIEFDVVISLLAWGFHFGIGCYRPLVSKGGVIIADIRRDSGGEETLAERGRLTVVHEAKKYRRVVVQC